MHYYQFHVSDYLIDTAHLNFEEDIVYRRLLDLYYTSEKPISSDIAAVSRRIRMPDHEHIVHSVLHEFFTYDEQTETWNHKRCEEGIQAYQAKRERNQRNGKLGGRPRKNNQETKKPESKNKVDSKSDDKKTPKPSKLAAFDIPEGVTQETWEAFKALRRAKKAPISQRAMSGIMREVNKARWTLEAALIEITARGWTGFNAEWVAPKQDKKTLQERNTSVLGGLTRGLTGDNNVGFLK